MLVLFPVRKQDGQGSWLLLLCHPLGCRQLLCGVCVTTCSQYHSISLTQPLSMACMPQQVHHGHSTNAVMTAVLFVAVTPLWMSVVAHHLAAQPVMMMSMTDDRHLLGMTTEQSVVLLYCSSWVVHWVLQPGATCGNGLIDIKGQQPVSQP